MDNSEAVYTAPERVPNRTELSVIGSTIVPGWFSLLPCFTVLQLSLPIFVITSQNKLSTHKPLSQAYLGWVRAVGVGGTPHTQGYSVCVCYNE